MAVIMRYFAEFGKHAFQHIIASVRKKESSRWLYHLLMSFSFKKGIHFLPVYLYLAYTIYRVTLYLRLLPLCTEWTML